MWQQNVVIVLNFISLHASVSREKHSSSPLHLIDLLQLILRSVLPKRKYQNKIEGRATHQSSYLEFPRPHSRPKKTLDYLQLHGHTTSIFLSDKFSISLHLVVFSHACVACISCDVVFFPPQDGRSCWQLTKWNGKDPHTGIILAIEIRNNHQSPSSIKRGKQTQNIIFIVAKHFSHALSTTDREWTSLLSKIIRKGVFDVL